MIRRDRLSSLIPTASAMSLLFAASVCAPSISAHGQTVALPYAVTASSGIGQPVAPVKFLAAPAFALSAIPSSAISADLNGDGKPDLIVASATTGEITVYLGTGQGRFSNPAVYSAGGHPVALASADLRGTGRRDILAANGTDKTVSVLFGLGDGKLGPAQVYSTGIEADLLAAGSLKAGGQPDVTVASTAGRSLAVLLNDGRGALLTATAQALPRTPASLTLARFSTSAHADLALANTDGTVSILSGRGDGTFNSATLLNVSSSALSLIVTGDFDRDGKTDLAVAQPGGRLLTILRGNGDGTFTLGASYAVGNDPIHALSLDVNGDGIPDLVTANRGSNTFSTLLGNGDGTFKAAVHSTVGDGPVALASGDFYGRGFTGLAILNAASKTVSVVDGNGDGSFRAAPSYSGDLSPRSIVSGDLNGDGRPDLAVANFCGADAACAKSGTISIYLAKASGGYTLASKLPVGAGPVAVALADLNGDKNLDAIVLNRTGKTVSILLGVGDGTFAEPRTLALADSPAALALGDFNKDGKADLAIVSDCGSAKCSQPGTMTILFGAGDGGFSLSRAYPVGYSPVSVAIADIDLDGNPDILVANRCGTDPTCAAHGTASVFTGDSKAGFTAKPDIALGNSPSSLALDSLSGGKTPDLVVTNESDGTVAVFRGNGAGTFAAPASYAVGSAPRSAVIADFAGTGTGSGTGTGTGTRSVAVVNVKDSTVSVLSGRGDGTLQPAVSYSVGAGPQSLAAVTGGSGTAAGIVTANGGSDSTTPGLEITDLTHAAPDIPSITTSVSVSGASASYAYGVPSPQNLLTATLTGSFTATAPTGIITLTDTSATPNAAVCTISTLTLSGATYTGSCSPSTPLTEGTHLISATYAGDSLYEGSTSVTPYDQQITAVEVGVTMVAGPTSLVYGQSGSYSVVLTAQDGSTATPVGTVTFSNALGTGTISCQETTGAQLAGQVTVSQGTATCTYIATTIGFFQLAASYAPGNANFTNTVGPGNSPLLLTVSQAQPSLALSNPSLTVNQAATITATLTPPYPGSGSPVTGSVVFKVTNNGTTTTTSEMLTPSSASSTAALPISSVAPGAYTVYAVYGGDSNFSSSSQSVQLTPGAATTSVAFTIGTGQTTANYGDTVVFTATVSSVGSSQPSDGAVTFTSASSTPLPCTATTVVSTSPYVVSCTVNSLALAPSSYTITASYAGDSSFSGSSKTAPLTVNKATPVLSIATTSSAVTVNQPVTFTAAFTGPNFTGPNKALPPSGGTFTFSTTLNNVATVLCSSTSTTCTASMTSAAVLHQGVNSVTVVYGGDTNYNSSSGAASQPTAAVMVSQGGTSVTLSSSASTQTTVDEQVTFTATVAQTQPATGGSPTAAIPLTGTVTFSDGSSTPPCPVFTLVPPSAVATCSTTTLPVGNDTVTATYTYVGATSSVTDFGNSSANSSQSVAAAASKLQNAHFYDNGNLGQTATVNDTIKFVVSVVADASSATTQPLGGTVVFTAAYTAFGSSSPVAVTFQCVESTVLTSSGTVSCTPKAPTNLQAGTYQVSAQYIAGTADPNFKNSPPLPSIPETVNQAPVTSLVISSGQAAPPTSIATQPVTYTATLTFPLAAASVGSVLPSGPVNFTTSGNATTACQAATVTSAQALAYSCAITFLSGTSSATTPFSVNAAYPGDNNFGPITASAVLQIVEDFSIAAPPANVPSSQIPADSAAPTAIFVTQGYSVGTPSANSGSIADPFFAAPAAAVTGISGFTGTVSFSACTIAPGTAAAGAPTCAAASTASTAPSATTAGALPFSITADAQTVPSATPYSFILQGVDSSLSSLTRSAPAFAVTVVPVTVNSQITSTSTETAKAIFPGAPPSDTYAFACSKYYNATASAPVSYGTSLTAPTSTSPGTFYCNPASATGPLASDGSASFQVVNQPASATAQLKSYRRSDAVYSAALFASPLLLFAAFLRFRRSPRQTVVRLLGLLALVAGLSQAIGCGSNGFIPSQVATNGNVDGTYQVLVSATDTTSTSTHATYYAVIQVAVIQ